MVGILNRVAVPLSKKVKTKLKLPMHVKQHVFKKW